MNNDPLATLSTNATTPTKKSSGCGCCLGGCFSLILFCMIAAAITGYLGWKYSTDVVLSDRVIIWSYENVAKPKLEQKLSASMSPAEKRRVMAQADATFQDFLSLPAEEKTAIKKEAFIALYYYSQNQIIPPEKIPHLLAFIQKHVPDFQQRLPSLPSLPRSPWE